MDDYGLSARADDDLAEIYLYSYRAFGEAAAESYFLGLRDSLILLAESPRLGRPVSEIRRGLFCYRHARHVIFYMIENAGIFVVRILHDAMDTLRHIDPETGEGQ